MCSSRIFVLTLQKGLEFPGGRGGFFLEDQTTEYRVTFNHAPNEAAHLAADLLLCYSLLSQTSHQV